MIHQQIKDLFFLSVEQVASNISQHAINPDTDFQRERKLPIQKLIPFLVSQGSSSTKVEMVDFWELGASMPTASALNQQRAKLKPEALEAVFHCFNLFFASTFWTKLQNIFGHCCMSKLDKVAKPWLAMIRPAI